jgi:signal peptidase II
VTALLAAVAATVAVDFASKQLVTARLAEGQLYGLGRGWGVRRVQNHRGSLGGLSIVQGVLLWVAVVVCTALALVALQAEVGASAVVGLGMTIGGATGNLTDRLVRGTVVDFVAAGPWPVFNLADAAMVLGVLLLARGLV